METRPESGDIKLFRKNEMFISITQGIVIAISILSLYYWFMINHRSLSETRTVVFSALVLSNILLTFTNRSFYESIFKTFRYKNNLAPWIILISLFLLVLTQLVPAVRQVFAFLLFTAYSKHIAV